MAVPQKEKRRRGRCGRRVQSGRDGRPGGPSRSLGALGRSGREKMPQVWRANRRLAENAWPPIGDWRSPGRAGCEWVVLGYDGLLMIGCQEGERRPVQIGCQAET